VAALHRFAGGAHAVRQARQRLRKGVARDRLAERVLVRKREHRDQQGPGAVIDEGILRAFAHAKVQIVTQKAR
jgi:hypothetical protein